MVKSTSKNSEEMNIVRHADFDKVSKIFYANFYFPDSNYVLKTPLASLNNMISFNEFKLERFELFKYTCMVFY